MSIADHSRIVVIGTSGCGKTTLASQLAMALGRTHIELDRLYWGPNWIPRDDFVRAVEEGVAEDEWIADGNYSKVRAAIWKRATTVVWLNYSFRVVLWRALRRTCSRIWTQEELFAGNRESFLQSFLHYNGIPWWVVRTFHVRHRELRQFLQQPEHAHLELFELRRSEDAVELVASVQSTRHAPARLS